MAANLSQSQERGEDIKSLVVELFVGLKTKEKLARALQFRAIEGLLLAFHFAEQIFLDPIGKIFGHLRFGPAEQKRTHSRSQAPTREWIFFCIEAPREQ
jgi:hypothetical protein